MLNNFYIDCFDEGESTSADSKSYISNLTALVGYKETIKHINLNLTKTEKLQWPLVSLLCIVYVFNLQYKYTNISKYSVLICNCY